MKLNELMQQAFPPNDPDPAAKSRIQSRTHALARKSKQRNRTRRLVFSMVAIGIAVGFTVFVGPMAYAGYRVQQIAGSVEGSQTAQFNTFTVDESGRETLAARFFYSKGRWRMEMGANYQIYINGTMWRYEATKRMVSVSKKPDGPFGNNPTGFTVGALVKDMAKWGHVDDKIEYGSEVVEGRQFETVSILNSGLKQRSVILADPKTHMPVQIRHELLANGSWQLKMVQRTEFDKPVDDSLFSTVFPAGTRIVDVAKEEETARKSLEGLLGTFVLGDRKIQVRSVFVNSRSHVFILFTDGRTIEQELERAKALAAEPRDNVARPVTKDDVANWPTSVLVKGANGASYRKPHTIFQPFMAALKRELCEGIVLRDGQIVQGAWLVPSQPGPWHGGSLTFTFARTTHYSQNGPIEIKRVWTYSPPAASQDLLPSWATSISMGPKVDKEVLDGEVQRG